MDNQPAAARKSLFEILSLWRHGKNTRQAADECRSCAVDPRSVLANLREQFDDKTLIEQGMLSDAGDGNGRLAPSLSRPDGPLIFFRPTEEQPPSAILTSRGTLVGEHAVFAAMQDGVTRQRAEKTGVIVAAGRIIETVSLRRLGLPATHGFGLHQLARAELKRLDREFGEGLPDLSVEHDDGEGVDDDGVISLQHDSDSAENEVAEAPGLESRIVSQPALALMGFSLRSGGEEVPGWVIRAAEHLTTARRDFDIDFPGVWVWRPAPEFFEKLHRAIADRDRGDVQMLLQDNLHAMVDIEELLADRRTPPPPVDYVTARQRLLNQRAKGPLMAAVDPLEMAAVHQDLERAIERELVGPMIAWGLQQSNPLVGSAALHLSTVAGMLHRLGPDLNGQLLGAQEQSVSPQHSTPNAIPFDQYVTLIDRFSRLLVGINRWFQ